METTSFGFAASLLFVGVPTIFLIGLFVSTSDGEKSSFYSDTSKGRLSPEPKKWFRTFLIKDLKFLLEVDIAIEVLPKGIASNF